MAAVDRALIEGAVAEQKLRDAAAALLYDPRQLEDDEARLFELRAMARKHRVQPDALAGLTDELRERLVRLNAGEQGLTDLEAAVATARSPSGCTARCSVVGATPRGTSRVRPSTVTDGSTTRVSPITRW